MRQFFHLVRRWWKQYWGSEDQYVRGVRLGTRYALNHTSEEVIGSMMDADANIGQDNFDHGWVDGCVAVLKLRGWSSDNICKAMDW